MKKLLTLVMLTFCITTATFAQDDKGKVKKTSTAPKKVSDAFDKNKQHKAYKGKQKNNGRTKKHIVDVTKGEEKAKVIN